MIIDTTNLDIFGIPPYFFCAVLGLVVAVCLYIPLMYSKKFCLQEYIKVFVIAILSLLFFAKIFGCISGIYRAIGSGEQITFYTIKNTGSVFYGGLFGFLFAYYWGIKSRLITIKEYHAIDILDVIIPLFHMISRIGCFLGGCCYGIKYKCFLSVVYTAIDTGVIKTEERIPVQLIEAIFNGGLFIYLFILVRKENWKDKKLLLRYILIYSFGRFLLEFIRGDMVRGVVYGISFSQMISILIWSIVIIFILFKRKRGEKFL